MLLIRHGQTVFNVHYGRDRIDPGVPDPGLTDEGRLQAAALADRLASHAARRLVVSPYRRALETAAILNAGLRLPVTVDPRVRERAGFSCDVGSPADLLVRDWPHLDFSGLAGDWWCHEGLPEEPEDALHARVNAFREEAARGPWHDLVVVTHWGVIRALTGLTVGNATIVRFDPLEGATTVLE